MNKTIYFDMDGTITNLYAVKDWCKKLNSDDVSPYDEAKPLVNPLHFQTLVNRAKSKGYRVGVITWTSKNGKSEYNSKVAQAKKDWLSKHFPKIAFDEVHVVKYGTNKASVALNPKGILFDDNSKVRNDWRGLAFEPSMINKVLLNL